MKTSFEKFMASSAVKSVEPTKVEMGKINVQLSIIDDLDNAINKAMDEYTKVNDIVMQFTKLQTALKGAYQSSQNSIVDMARKKALVEANMKELGLSFDKVPSLSKAEKFANSYADIQNEVKKIVNAL